MNELLRAAFEEASRQAKGLPGEPVAVIVFTFAADGTCAPVLAGEAEAIPMVAGRLMEVAGAMLDELTENCHEEPAASGVPNVRETPTPAELIYAERIAARAIRKAARRE